MKQVTPQQLKEWIEHNQNLLILDVREPWEFEITHIPGSINVPLKELSNFLQNKNITQTVITVCHHGARSSQACMFLENFGIKNLYNLVGGIDAYAKAVDPSMPLYE